ncbi:hypothetical protein ACWDTK_06110, partial [Nocardia cyriacigeorgica]
MPASTYGHDAERHRDGRTHRPHHRDRRDRPGDHRRHRDDRGNHRPREHRHRARRDGSIDREWTAAAPQDFGLNGIVVHGDA